MRLRTAVGAALGLLMATTATVATTAPAPASPMTAIGLGAPRDVESGWTGPITLNGYRQQATSASLTIGGPEGYAYSVTQPVESVSGPVSFDVAFEGLDPFMAPGEYRVRAEAGRLVTRTTIWVGERPPPAFLETRATRHTIRVNESRLGSTRIGWRVNFRMQVWPTVVDPRGRTGRRILERWTTRPPESATRSVPGNGWPDRGPAEPGEYRIVLTAVSQDGRRTTTSVPIRVRR